MAQARTNYTHLFGSPLMAHRWEDGPVLNAALRGDILAQEAAHEGMRKTNIGGWHSTIGQLEFCGEAGRTLIAHMQAMADEATARVTREHGIAPKPMQWTVHAWANVNRRGHFNQIHTHPGSTWSGTYYVDAGNEGADAGEATSLLLFDPCQGRSNTFLPGIAPSSFTIRPEAGLMVLFPSYLAHTVAPHQADTPRISIAFNVRREPFP